jgi:hypothetical protein
VRAAPHSLSSSSVRQLPVCVSLAPTPLSAVLVRLLSPVGHTKLSGDLSHDTQAKCVGAARDTLVRYTAFAMHA